MKKKRSIRSIIFTNMALVTLAALGLWNGIWVYSAYQEFQGDATVIRREYVESQKELIKQEVGTVISFVNNMRTQTETRLKESIRSRVQEAIQIAANIYERNKGKKSVIEIKTMIKDALRPIRFNQGRGYYFAFNFKGIEELFADRPSLEGTDMLPLRGGRGEYVVREMLELIYREGEGYYHYTWTKPGFGDKYFRKIAFVKYFEPLDWIIGTGEYIDDVEAQIQNEVVERVVELRFGQEGYFFGSTFEGGSLFSNGAITKHSGNILDLTDPNGVKIIQEQIRLSKQPRGGFVSYVWNKIGSDNPAPKVSYVRGIPEWGWVIGTGVYLDTIETKIDQRKQELFVSFEYQVLRSLLLLIAFMALIFIWANRYSRRTSRNLAAFSRFFKNAATRSEPMNTEDIYLQEFEEIAEAAQEMLRERKAAEDALRKSEEQLSLAIEGSGVGLWDWRIDTGEVFFNQRWAEMLGFSMEELAPLTVDTWRRLVHPDDLEKTESLMREHFNLQTQVYECEIRMKHNNGRWIWVLDRGMVVERDRVGRPLRMTGTHLDITGRKRAEDALAESEERFRNMTINSPVGVMLHTGEKIMFVNPALVRMFGAPDEDWFVGRNVWELLGPENVDYARKRSAMVLERDQAVAAKEYRYIRSDGGEFFAETMGLPIILAGQKRIYSLLIDVTERKKAEQEKEILESQLRQAQKMDALGTLAGGIAHDFNNILAAIIGYSELALDDAEQGEDNSDKVKEVLKAGKRAKDLVNQILTFSRKLEPELRPLDLNQIVNQTEKMLERTIPRMVSIEQKLSPDLRNINADPGQLTQILMNLGTNANDAMPGGGQLKIETDNVFLDREYCSRHAGVSPGEYVRLTVSDTGVGMSRETLEHIFDPFFTQKEVGKGTGLGLATVYGVVKNHDGHITCETELGQGSVFRIFFPAIHQADKAAQGREALNEELAGGNETVLVVDDEESIRDLGRRILSEKGYPVLLAGTGEEALAVYRGKMEEISLVILDISMPGMGGHRCLQEILRLDPRAKVIIVSGYSLNNQTEDVVESGAAAYVAKPFTKAELLRTVREVLDG